MSKELNPFEEIKRIINPFYLKCLEEAIMPYVIFELKVMRLPVLDGLLCLFIAQSGGRVQLLIDMFICAVCLCLQMPKQSYWRHRNL